MYTLPLPVVRDRLIRSEVGEPVSIKLLRSISRVDKLSRDSTTTLDKDSTSRTTSTTKDSSISGRDCITSHNHGHGHSGSGSGSGNGMDGSASTSSGASRRGLWTRHSPSPSPPSPYPPPPSPSTSPSTPPLPPSKVIVDIKLTAEYYSRSRIISHPLPPHQHGRGVGYIAIRDFTDETFIEV